MATNLYLTKIYMSEDISEYTLDRLSKANSITLINISGIEVLLDDDDKSVRSLQKQLGFLLGRLFRDGKDALIFRDEDLEKCDPEAVDTLNTIMGGLVRVPDTRGYVVVFNLNTGTARGGLRPGIVPLDFSNCHTIDEAVHRVATGIDKATDQATPGQPSHMMKYPETMWQPKAFVNLFRTIGKLLPSGS
tara:strand:- start:225582 stop:226151 length:570 start_codon:yes stop_codon:yes gene_type:complete